MTEPGDPTEPSAPQHRALAIGLALIAGAALVFACFSSHWLANGGRDGSIAMGLRSSTECGSVGMLLGPGPDDCRALANSAYVAEWESAGSQYASAAFVPCGWATLIACLIAAFGLFGAVIVGLLPTKPNLPMSPSTFALLGIMVALITGCVFVATKPGPGGFAGVGLTFWIFGAGAVLGLAAAILLAKVNRPRDPDLLDDAIHPDDF